MGKLMDCEPRLEGREDEVGGRMKHVQSPSQELRSSGTDRQVRSLGAGTAPTKEV